MDVGKFRTILLIKEHENLVNEFYLRLPKKIKKLVDSNHVMIGYSPKSFPDENEIAYFIKPNLIEFNCKYWDLILKKDFFIGCLAHELGHFYINNLNPFYRFILLKKYNSETLADSFACGFGFEKELKIVNDLRNLKKNSNP